MGNDNTEVLDETQEDTTSMEEKIEAVNEAEKQVENKPVGFAAHPENINRNGRPHKGHSITETIRAMMDEKPEIKRALGQKILQMAMQGDITAMKTIWNYIDGMPMQYTDVTTAGEKLDAPRVIIKTHGDTK